MWLLAFIPPIFVSLIFVEILIDRIWFRKYYRLRDCLANLQVGLGHQIVAQLLKVMGFALYIVVYDYARLYSVEMTWYWWVVLFFGLDFCYYWAHRFSHELNILWVDHSVHHMGEDYNLAAALRLGYYQLLYTYLFYLPLAVAGFPPEAFILILAISTIYQFWTHTELIRTLGWYEKIFVTPSHHRVHHARNPQYIDKNYGGVFIFWDYLFGSFAKEQEDVVFGITQPPASLNPMYMQVHHLRQVWRDFRTVKGFKNKLGVLVQKPGWLPREMGGPRQVPEVQAASYKKYDPEAVKGQNVYLFLHTAVVIGIIMAFAGSIDSLSWPLKMGGSTWCFFNMFALGTSFDNRPWGLWPEMLRHLSLIAVSLLLWEEGMISTVVLAGIIPAVLMSLAWCFRLFGQIRKKQQKPQLAL